jgi:tRNA 2-thiouridine synthesizing protein A
VDQEASVTEVRATPDRAAEVSPRAEWDAGDMGCGELVLELRTKMLALRPGEYFRLIARDPGASEDLPAWCRMTGHRLVQAKHPQYLIETRKDL